jgi:hypothetical protein
LPLTPIQETRVIYRLHSVHEDNDMKTRILILTLGLGLGLSLGLDPSAQTQEAKPGEAKQSEGDGIFDQEGAADEAGAPKQEGVEPQLKGPVHEAFMEAVTEPQPGATVAKEPPADLEEMPPQDVPEGKDIQWIGGYWDFDQDRDDFTWISGIYRNPPVRRHWMAGHWVKIEAGWQRQRGLWALLEQTEITFLPPPPEAKAEEQETKAPDESSFYAAGYWEYKEKDYTWKPGSWNPLKYGYIWVPAHYIWSPCGYVFVPGYWDYVLDRRGLLFAPVCIDHRYVKPGFTYTPTYVVHDVCLQDALFVRPGCGYFFGAYFNQKQYVSWPDFCVRRTICDPLFGYYKWHHKSKGGWERDTRALYTARHRGEIPPPPSSLKEQSKLFRDFKNKSVTSTHLRRNVMVAPVQKVNTRVVKLGTLDQSQVLDHKKFSDQLRNAGKRLAQNQSQLLQERRGAPLKGNDQPKVLKFESERRKDRGQGNVVSNNPGGDKIGKSGGKTPGGGKSDPGGNNPTPGVGKVGKSGGKTPGGGKSDPGGNNPTPGVGKVGKSGGKTPGGGKGNSGSNSPSGGNKPSNNSGQGGSGTPRKE